MKGSLRYTLCGMMCLGVFWGTVPPGWSAMYRWRDAAGNTHFTDNLANIPAAYRDQAQEMSADRPTTITTVSPSSRPRPIGSAPATASPAPSAETQPAQLQQKLQTLQQQLAAARQERQRYLDELNTIRPIRTNPAFGSKRRQAAEIGQALATVERQIDKLQAEVQAVQESLATTQGSAHSQPPLARPAAGATVATTESAATWQQRFQTARGRLQQVQTERQLILEQLSGETKDKPGSLGRQSREVLQQAKELQRLEQEIRQAEAALASLTKAAEQSGVPSEWRQ